MEKKLTADEEVKRVASGNKVFSGRLYDLLRKEEGNIVMSPFSISGVMAMVNSGANGETLSQLTQGMSFPTEVEITRGYRNVIPALRTNENFTLETANTVFTQEGFKILSEYDETLHKHFHATIQVTDFSEKEKAVCQINDWVKNATQEKIKDLISADMVNELTSLVLVNAIYFKADWASKFDPNATKEKDFHLSDGKSTKKVQIMRKTKKFQWAELKDLEASMVELPYKGDRVVMQILLPDAVQGLSTMEDRLGTIDLEQLFRDAESERLVALELPEFRLEKSINLNNYLQQLGMKDMFESSKADFSGIDGSKDLYVSLVLQKAFIEVNEEGSETAAATVVMMEKGCSMPSPPTPPIEFKADHPFLFFLRDKLTGMLLFQGRVEDP